ncbi:MAG: F0F1 ATP synthase subunit delta [Desulfohalobiaceae bacterium]|nr:F0F1 ATP synthase subunit delta [Desulfohalobiaceae bacterium]
MKEQVIAKRYARALFALGQDQGAGAQKQYGEELARFAEALEAAPLLDRTFRNPVIKIEDKKSVISKVAERLGLSRMVINFCLFLADKGRLEHFLSIQAYYNKLMDEQEGILRGSLITAIELSSEKQDNVRSGLEKQLNRNLVLDFETDQDILGGLLLRIGDRLYDASIKAQLEQVKEKIKRGE